MSFELESDPSPLELGSNWNSHSLSIIHSDPSHIGLDSGHSHLASLQSVMYIFMYIGNKLNQFDNDIITYIA